MGSIISKIKRMIFDLSIKLYPGANIFSITTGAVVLKLNYTGISTRNVF